MINNKIKCLHCENVLQIDTAVMNLSDGFESPFECPICNKQFIITTNVDYTFVPRNFNCAETGNCEFKPVLGKDKRETVLDFFCFKCDTHIRVNDIYDVEGLVTGRDLDSWFTFYSEIIADYYPEFFKTKMSIN